MWEVWRESAGRARPQLDFFCLRSCLLYQNMEDAPSKMEIFCSRPRITKKVQFCELALYETVYGKKKLYYT